MIGRKGYSEKYSKDILKTYQKDSKKHQVRATDFQ
jgi:hypothetical protein